MDPLLTPYMGWHDLRLYLGVQTVLLGIVLWMLWGKAWRREPPGFIWRTFLDDRGVPDGKLLAVCHTLTVMTITMCVGWLGILLSIPNPWPPAYVWASWDFIAVAGIFGAVYATKKYYEHGGSTAPMDDGLAGCNPTGAAGAGGGDTGGAGAAGTSEPNSSTSPLGGPSVP